MSMKLEVVPSVKTEFIEDKANNDLVSLQFSRPGNVSNVAYALAPAPVRLQSFTTTSKKGVTSVTIKVQVPLYTVSKISLAGGQLPSLDSGKFAQARLEVTLPNSKGLLGNTVGQASESAGTVVVMDEITANRIAVATALNALLALVVDPANPGPGEGHFNLLTEDMALVMDALNSSASYEGSTLNASHPLVRGFAGLVPVDPNMDRGQTADADV